MANVVLWTGLSRTTIYRLISERQFPGPVRLAARAVAWRSSDLAHWSEARRAHYP